LASGRAIEKEIEKIASALGRTVPLELVAAAAQLGRSAWPEMVERWSRLTPTGFPIELTVTDADPILRWTTEIAGPEIVDAHRLDLVAMRLASAGQPVSPPLLEALQAAQRGRDLQYGAWLGGRAIDDTQSRFKLYGEIPAGVSCHKIPLPPTLREAIAHAPDGTLPRMIGVEPARRRIELYLRLPTLDLDDLRPLLSAAGHAQGSDVIERSLPDGKRRLAGRRLGISLAVGEAEAIEVALFVSARSLFPAAPEMLRGLIPAIASVPETLARLTLVTLGLKSEGGSASFAVGVTSVPTRPSNTVGPRSSRRPLAGILNQVMNSQGPCDSGASVLLPDETTHWG
jgi:hypothetical protein